MLDRARRASNAHYEWVQVLDDLESYLTFVPGADVEHVRPWCAPEHIGPLPAELVERARKVLFGQRELVQKIERAQRTTGRHLAAVRSVPAVQDARTSVYVDVMS